MDSEKKNALVKNTKLFRNKGGVRKMDKDGYPEEHELKRIREWPYDDFIGLMEYVYDLWKYSEPNPGWCGWKQRGRTYRLHTGGWSGNEEIIGALRDNTMFWATCWFESKRGGHFLFKVPIYENNKNL